MLGIVLHKGDDKLLGALALQKCSDFTVYLPQGDPAQADYEARLTIRHGDWRDVGEPLLCVLEEGALPDAKFVSRILRMARRHPDFDVYHVNVKGEKAFPRKADAKKVFRLAISENVTAPLSSFIFRSEKLRERAVFQADGDLQPLSTVLNCARERPVRKVWCLELEWSPAAAPSDPVAVEAAIRDRIDLFRWTESFFGDDDYPLSVGDQLDLFADEVAKLYPSYTEDDLKEMMESFQVSQGTIRKLRASAALRSALKEREKQLA